MNIGRTRKRNTPEFEKVREQQQDGEINFNFSTGKYNLQQDSQHNEVIKCSD